MSATGMSWVLHQVLDRRHQGMVAAVFEHPSDWQTRSDVVWNFQNVSVPVVAWAEAADAGSGEQIAFLPGESFCWLEPNYGMTQPGQFALGQTHLPPMPAAEALTRWLIPKYHSRTPGLQLRSAGPGSDILPLLAFESGSLPAEGVRARLTYAEQGRTFDEEWLGIVVSQQVPYHGPMGTTMQTNWGFARALRYRAPSGSLDTRLPLFHRIAASLRVNPRWEQLCAGINQQLQQQFNAYIQAGYSQIQAAGQLSQAISANNDAMLRGFEQQRQAAAHSSRPGAGTSRSANDAFSDYIRGVETVQDPYQGTSQQDANFQYHWTDGFGNYHHSNDPFFNPNQESNQSWTLMKPVA